MLLMMAAFGEGVKKRIDPAGVFLSPLKITVEGAESIIVIGKQKTNNRQN